MAETPLEQRLAELRLLQQSDPRALIDLYRKIAGELTSKQMPQGVSFSRMIETILKHESHGTSAEHATG